MERRLHPTARALAALSLLTVPAAGQIHLVQSTPAEIGTAMTLEVTGATPNAPIFLTGSVRVGPLAAGIPVPLGGPGLFHVLLGTTNAFGALGADVLLPPATSLLGRLLPLRAVDLGAFSLASTLSNPLAAWFGPHPVFASPTPEVSGQFGWSFAIGDFLGTSDLDLAVGALETVAGAAGAGKVHVFAGPGFTSVTTLTSPAPSMGGGFGWSLAALDWNGDGATDLAAGEPGADGLFPLTDIGAVHVFLHPVGGTGPTTFVDPTPVALENLGTSLAAAQLDSTPSDELVAGAPFHTGQPFGSSASVLVLSYSGGSAVFGEVAEPDPAEGGFGECVASGNVDGDAFDEILVGEPLHSEPGASLAGAVHLIDGGALTLTLLDDAPASGEQFGSSVAIGDLDGDGLGDLLVGVVHENQAQLYLAPAFASASPVVLSPAHPGDLHGGRAVAVGDVNGDGKLDALVAASSCTGAGICGSVTAYLGKQLAASAYVADAAISPRSLAVGDVDGDGRDEIVTGYPSASLVLAGAGAFLLSE